MSRWLQGALLSFSINNISKYSTLIVACQHLGRPSHSTGGTEGQKITFNIIKQRLGDLIYKVACQKFEDPADGEASIKDKFADLT